MNVGIDSMVLIYAGAVPAKKGAKRTKEQQDLAVYSQLLLHIHRDDTIILPTIAIAELLVPVSLHDKGALSAVLSKKFVCAPFDLKAASIASDLWAQYKNSPNKLKYDDRNILKADLMIIAAAKSAGATVFYSHDKQCRALADLVMTAKDLPKQDPDDMYAVDDIKSGKLKP